MSLIPHDLKWELVEMVHSMGGIWTKTRGGGSSVWQFEGADVEVELHRECHHSIVELVVHITDAERATSVVLISVNQEGEYLCEYAGESRCFSDKLDIVKYTRGVLDGKLNSKLNTS